jgi:hypothetical protein
MSKQRRSFTAEFKREAAALVLEQGYSHVQACNDPADSAQVTPLIRKPSRAFSFPTPGEAAGCCRT